MEIVYYNRGNYLKYLENVAEPSNKAAMSADSTLIEEIQHKMYRSGTTSLQVLNEPYKMVYSGLRFKRCSPFLEVFNEMVAKMEPNGLMEYWRRFQSYSTTKIEDIGPQVLTMDHLRLGFLACCIPMTLAVIAFIGEFAWSRLVILPGKNTNDLRKCNQKVKVDPKIFPFRIQPQARNVEPEELIEMHGIAVAEVHQEARVDFEDLNGSYNEKDLVRNCQELCDDIDDVADIYGSTPTLNEA